MLLVTGITGHSGKCFLQELINQKYEGEIRCIVREASDTSMLDSSGLNIEKLVGDITDQLFLDKAMEGVKEIVHISSIFHSIYVIQSAVKYNVKRAILVHTTGIYSKYKSASAEYQQIEHSVQEIINNNKSNLQLIYLRPTMIYGYLNDRNMIVFIKLVDKFRIFPVISQGKSLLQPVNGRDLGKAYYELLVEKDITSGDYILSGDKPISMLEMFQLISSFLNKRTYFISVPLSLGVAMAKILKFVTFKNVDYVEKVQRMGEDRCFSHNQAKTDFGYNPMPFNEGLKLEIEQYVKSKHKLV